MNELKNMILRFAQTYKFDDRLENITLCCELNAIGTIYWVFSQGKIQFLSPILKPDLTIIGSLQQWMETAYNPFQPINGCQIQGDSRLLQILKENIEGLHAYYQKSWHQYPLTRSVLYHAQTWIQRYAPLSPWVSQNDRDHLQSELRQYFHRIDRCQWDVNFLSRKQTCS